MENMIRLERAIQIKNLNRTGEIRILFDPVGKSPYCQTNIPISCNYFNMLDL